MSQADDLAEFMYMDDQEKPRSKYLEYMFEDLFHGKELDHVFKDNFLEYCETFFGISIIDDKVFTDEREALRFVSTFGLVSVKPISKEWLSDDTYSHCLFESTLMLKGNHVKQFKQFISPSLTVAPNKHYAILITFIEFLREITVAHYNFGKEEEPTLH